MHELDKEAIMKQLAREALSAPIAPRASPARDRICRRIGVGVALACAIAAASFGAQMDAARAETGSLCEPSGNEPVFAINSRALTRPEGTELTLRVSSLSAACRTPDSLKHVQVKTLAADGSLTEVRNLNDVSAPGGRADLNLGALGLGQFVRSEVLVQTGDPERTYVLRAATEVTEFAVDASEVIVPSVAGYGGQFNQHVYAKLSSPPVNEANVLDMEQKVVGLQPQLARIFFNLTDLDPKLPDRMASFVRTVQLAQRAGATINITWQGGGFNNIQGNMGKFGAVLLDLVLNKGITNLRWVTVQNEPNDSDNKFTKEQWEAMYRALDQVIANIRGQVHFMGGDLVQEHQREWFDYMASNMSDILDAWSIHVFWDYWDTAKLQARLNGVREIWDAERADLRKPLYVAEYGVRGIRNFNGEPIFAPGVWADGTPMSQTNINAFQHAWFDILSARLGYLGTIKWDSYFGKYDNGTQAFYMIGSPVDGWPLYPIYHAVRLWTMTVKPTWQVVGLEGDSGTKLLTAYSSKSGELTVIGLDREGASLNVASDTQVSYSIGGLPPSTSFRLVIWNGDGDGRHASAGTIVSDTAGVATVAAPLHSVFALTTAPVEGP
jgi:hypothetical protein